MSKIVNLAAQRRHTSIESARSAIASDLRPLYELQLLCAQAIDAGGLDASGPTLLDLTAAVHAVVQGTEWKVRFYRGQGSGE